MLQRGSFIIYTAKQFNKRYKLFIEAFTYTEIKPVTNAAATSLQDNRSHYSNMRCSIQFSINKL